MDVGAPESTVQSAENRYQPVWLPVVELDREPIMPEEVRGVVRRAARSRTALPGNAQ